MENNEKHLCDYGCGQEAKFYFKTSGKWCCSKHHSKCPTKRNQRSIKQIKNKLIRENPGLCDYGCGKESKYYFKSVDKWCCSKNVNSCPIKRKNASDSHSKGELLSTEKEELCDYGCGQKAKFQITTGKPKSEEHKQKLKGPKSEEHKQKLRKPSVKKKLAWTPERKIEQKEYMLNEGADYLNSFHTEDTNIKLSILMKKAWGNPESIFNQQDYRNKFRDQCLNGHSDLMNSKPRDPKKIKIKNEKTKKRMLDGGAVYCNSFIQNPSKPQVELFIRVKKLFSTAILNYPCYRGKGKRNYSLDIAIPELMICFESDGSWFHQDTEKDLIRQKEIEDSGWRVIRYFPVDSVKQVPSIDQIKKDIEKIIGELNES